MGGGGGNFINLLLNLASCPAKMDFEVGESALYTVPMQYFLIETKLNSEDRLLIIRSCCYVH